MATQQISALQFLSNPQKTNAAVSLLAAGAIDKLRVPVPQQKHVPTLVEQIANGVTKEQMKALQNININLHFESKRETQIAFNTIKQAVPEAKDTGKIPDVTMKQGIIGGAVIGGVTGAGVLALLQGLKSTADAFGNPILSAVGAVIVGIGIGATGGAIFSKTSEYNLKIGPTAVELAAKSAK